jgi:hypothetical protein|tara:strand:- start:5858 stop:6565 length:708 start_codon:yes stop_codon:yes gene_type:complete
VELSRIAIEKPGQLGSLFMADAPTLKQLTANIEPLVDNFPQRISPSTEGMREQAALYSELLNVDNRKIRLASSAYFFSLFPEEFIRETFFYFDLQKMLMIGTGNPHVDYPLPYFWDSLTLLLRDTDLQTLPLLLLNGSPRELEILATSGPVNSLEYQRSNIKKLILERRYLAAIEAINQYLLDDTSPDQVDYYGRVSLMLAALAGELQMDELVNSQSFAAFDAEFKAWFIQRFGG